MWLSEQLYDRMLGDEEEFSRRPTNLVVNYVAKDDSQRTSRRTALPWLRDVEKPVQHIYGTE